MRIDVVTIFPELFGPFVNASLLGRAVERGLLDVRVHDLRAFTHDRHRQVDDEPYGGGPGMVMKPEPFFEALEALALGDGVGALAGEVGPKQAGTGWGGEKAPPHAPPKTPGESARLAAPEVPYVVLLSPQGRVLRQEVVRELVARPWIVLLCGRYEGVDERVAQHLADEELSIGDYILGGGEVAAMVVVEAVARLVPGVVGEPESVAHDSFEEGLLDHPHYTRPAEFRGWKVPEVLQSGNHAAIKRWRREEAVRRTRERRPDLLGDHGPQVQ